MVDFQEDNFEQKLLSLKDTQESIQSLSIWCLKHQSNHKKVVSCWLHVLKKVKLEQRVTLFYLANDVIQYSKRKGYPFVESWATALQKATPLVREDKVKHKILRLFKIWDERSIYDETFLADLSGLLTANTKKSSQPSAVDLIQEFQPSLLFSKIRKCKILEEDTDLRLKIVKDSNIPIQDLDALQIAVKDRRNGDDLIQDIDDGLVKLEAYTKALELEIKERIEVINVLEVSDQFYETQRGEAKVVCNAYRNFGNRIKALKRKLDELLPTLPSPVPSPDINAPSPSSGSDIEIPEESKTVYDSEKSFIGTDFVTAMNNAAGDKSYQYMREQSYDIENNQSYSVHSLPNYDSYPQSRDLTLPMQGYYSNISQNNMESPASPSEKHLATDPFSYRPANVQTVEQGNPIEVISSGNSDNHNFSVGQFLQNLMSNNGPPTPVPSNQSKIPGLESPTSNSREVFNFIESKVKEDNVPLWNDKPLTKYQSWPSPDISWNPSQETPVSPPAFERESYSRPVEYVDTNLDTSRFPPPFVTDQRAMDIDHRILNTKPPGLGHEFDMQIAAIPLPKHDVDDRLPLNSSIANHNLISLTESPSVNDTWKSDSDFRAIPMPPSPPMLERGTKAQDIIESVDMEMSDEEDSRNEDRKNDPNKFKKFAAKKDEEKKSISKQLQPPPNPWDLMNMPLDDEANKPPVTDFMPRPGMDMPRPNFNQFSMPPNPRGIKFGDMNFPPPLMPMMRLPSGESIFRPRMEFPQIPNGNGFNRPFNFLPDGAMMFPPPNNMNQMRKEPFQNTSFSEDNRQYGGNEYTQSINTIEPLIQSRQFEKRLTDKPPPTFEENPEFTAGGPKGGKSVRSNLKEISLSDVLERTMNEESEKVDKPEHRINYEEEEINDNIDLYGEEGPSDVGPDDSDDLYNNIEETNEFADHENVDSRQNFPIDRLPPRKPSGDARFMQNIPNSHFMGYEADENMRNSTMPPNAFNSNRDMPRMKAPFQATVPKLPKPIMAPPNFMEDCNNEERNPWPMLPVIDLSTENNSPSEFEPPSDPMNDSVSDRHHPLAFLKVNGATDFRPRFGRGGGGMTTDFRPRGFVNNAPRDRRFPNPVPPSPRVMDMSRPRRFSNPPRQDFRPRNSNQEFRPRGNMLPNQDFRPRVNMPLNQEFRPRGGMTMNQDQMRRMPRPPFPGSPGAVNVRGNYQNSPRMFKGGPPFRRGW